MVLADGGYYDDACDSALNFWLGDNDSDCVSWTCDDHDHDDRGRGRGRVCCALQQLG